MKGKKEKCARMTADVFCAQHRFQLRRGMQQPAPCRICGCGVMASHGVCRGCGGLVLARRMLKTERTARSNFQIVLRELTTKPSY